MGRAIGIDLHRDVFTAVVLENDKVVSTRNWSVKKLGEFAATLLPTDKVAVEMTTNVRLFYDAVSPRVERVDVVNTLQFQVISQSVKKTDKNDAEALARFLAKDMLPTVRMKSRHMAKLASLTRARDGLVKQRTRLKNRVNNLFAAVGMNLKREHLSSAKALAEVESWAEEIFDAVEVCELRAVFRQIRSINESVGDMEKMIESEGAKLKGFRELTSIKGIASLSATILLTVIDDVERFPDSGKLASYIGLVPRVSRTNETVHYGRITKRGSKLARTTLVQCGLVAKKYNEHLAAFHERLKRKKGGGKANIALARKLLEIVYRTLKNEWVFEDFPSFRLKDGTVPTKSRGRVR